MQAEHEELLILKAKNGDESAFGELIKNYKNMILSIAYYFSRNEQDALDMAQEVYVKIYKNIEKFEGKSKFSTWVYSVSRNTCIDEYKRITKSRKIYTEDGDEDILSEPQGPEDVVIEKEFCDFVRNLLSMLPGIYGRILTLRYIESLSYKEISEKLGCSEGTVKSRLFRGKKIMKKILDEKFKNL